MPLARDKAQLWSRLAGVTWGESGGCVKEDKDANNPYIVVEDRVIMPSSEHCIFAYHVISEKQSSFINIIFTAIEGKLLPA